MSLRQSRKELLRFGFVPFRIGERSMHECELRLWT